MDATVLSTDGVRDRGQAGVLGFALLIGIVAIGITTVLVIGNAGLADTKRQVEMEQAVQTFTLVDSQASTVALSKSPGRSVELGAIQRSGTVQVETSGRIVIETDDGTTYLNQELGALVYRHDEGGVVAYQGGGVWRGTGRESVLVSPPELHYRDGTLTLPLVVLEPSSDDDSDGIRFRYDESRTGLSPGPIRNEVVNIRITSEYYAGWAEYFRTRIDGVTVDVDHATETVEVTLADLDIDGDYETGVVAQGDVDVGTGSASIDSEVQTSGTVSVDNSASLTCDDGSGVDDCATEGRDTAATPLDATIERLVDQSASSDPAAGADDGGTLTAGSYYSDGFLLDGESLTLDLSTGNVTLFVDGNVGLSNGNIEVVNGDGTNHYAKVFTTGDFAMRGGSSSVTVDTGNATRFQLFGTSEHHFALGQSNNPGYVGTVYAPRNEPATGTNDAVDEFGGSFSSIGCADTDICIGTGSGTFRGAVIGGPVSAQQSTQIVYAEELSSFQPSLPAGAVLPPPISFLHLSANRVEVTGVPGSGGVGLPAVPSTPTPAPSTATPAPSTPTPAPSTSTPTSSTPTPDPTPTGSIDGTSPAGNKYDVEYSVSDGDGDLSEVTVTVTYEKNNGNTKTKSTTVDVSGSTDSGTVTLSLGSFDEATQVDLTVKDEAGNTRTDTESDPN